LKETTDMRKLVVGTFLTLDGVMQAPGGPEEDRSGNFEHGGWMVPFVDDMIMRVMTDWVRKADGLVLGRRTYEIFAGSWPYASADDPIAAKLNSVRKYVASRTLNRVDWQNSSLLTGDIAEAVRKLKGESGGELQVHGSGELIQTLLRHDLIDEFRIWFFPVLLGTGKRLFGEGTVPAGLKLVETQTSSTGAVLQVHQAAGKPSYGSYEVAEPAAVEVERRRGTGAAAGG
jgi:dihydrofolate reductase